ncbi:MULTISPECIES: phage holin family protein [unclassified Streptomyces]|uniref:phage holin family protein n=1 Tax=unclassified Streptomyces TaxID=2593676 RepID=UPI002E377288|nr:phage holin family protein [Streptomyces sp. NBC_01268]
MSDPFDGAERSLGQLVASATAEMSALVHDEIALAKAEIKQDVKRGAMGSAAGLVAVVVLLFSLPLLSFALAYGIQAWSHWHISVCFLLSFAANVLLAVLLGLVAYAKFRKMKPPEKSIASAKQTAAIMQNVKPHPRTAGAAAQDKAVVVARSSA